MRIAGDEIASRALKALGPIGIFLPLRGAVQTYVLGRLFDRYLDRRGADQGFVIDVEEAAQIRAAIDGALARAVTVHVEARNAGIGAEDDLDPTAAWVDRALQRVARVPSRLTRRLDAGFDDLIEHDGH
jgi:GNAT superfamily N-acetyltransferase